jgi:predicted transcriptional regulator
MKVNQVYDCTDILISVAPIYTKSILNGKKTVELRRRRMNVNIGTRVWIYSKLPVGSVEATAVVESVSCADPESLWSEFQDAVGITHTRGDDGTEHVVGVGIDDNGVDERRAKISHA